MQQSADFDHGAATLGLLSRSVFVSCARWILLSVVIGCGRTPELSVVPQATTETALSPNSVMLAPAGADIAAGLTDAAKQVQRWERIEPLPKQVAVFDHVFWEPRDTVSLRRRIRETDLVKGRSVLEIGTGSGIVALCCLQAEAACVVATDVNPWAVRNAVFNGENMQFADRLDVRLVSQNRSAAWTAIRPEEKFDVLVSNPPWELGKPTHIEQFGDFDPGFRLMESIMDGLPDHLNPGGRVFLTYGCVSAIRHLLERTTARGHKYTIHDDRTLDQLPEVFLPGMLIEIHLNESP